MTPHNRHRPLSAIDRQLLARCVGIVMDTASGSHIEDIAEDMGWTLEETETKMRVLESKVR